MSFYTPLRYPGGKARLGPWLGQVLRHNRISGGAYAEPYAGGAGAALFLLMRGFVDEVHINDADPVVYSFWHAATRNSARLIGLVEQTPVTMDTWEEQHEILANAHRHSHLRVGFATFFLNRTNRSGILAGGVIGGKQQTGPFKLDARYNKADLVSRLVAIGQLAESIKITCEDALDWLHTKAPELPKNSLIYLDPPYFEKGSLLYRNFYEVQDHAAVAKAVMKLRTPLVVTYDDVPQIRKLYSKAPCSSFTVHYSTHTERPESTEVLFYRNITLPRPPQLTRGVSLPPAVLDKQADVVPKRVDKAFV